MTSSFSKRKKNIGTLVPVAALQSLNSKNEDQGTYETGMVFLDWLSQTGQNAWQMLPLHQTQLENRSSVKRVPSPYKGYGIGLDPKYLSSRYANSEPTEKELKDFKTTHIDWIYDYALFCAFTDHFGTDDWREWDEGLRTRKKEVINNWSAKLTKEIDSHILVQWQLHKSYKDLREKADKLEILLIGDLPFYISVKSPIVWAHQDVFQLEKGGKMRYVSGLPDTPAAHFGRQVWGHPLYKWGRDNKKIIEFWKMRLKYLSILFDLLRFDHAKGLFDYGVIDPENKEIDAFRKGPGVEVFEELVKYCKTCGLSIFAEDSGENLLELRKSLKKLKIAGIKILRFALNEKKKELIESYAYISKYPINTVAYTSTPDTESLISYLGILTTVQKQKLSRATGVMYENDDKIFAKRFRDALIHSSAKMVILPIQDWLLTTERINVPGTEREVDDPNWRYVLKIPIEKLPIVHS